MKNTIDPKRIYQDTSVRGATSIELVVLLYNSAIDDMRRALQAMQQNNLEVRAANVGHALLVIQQLQGTLDFERGGPAARQFEQFYNLIRAKLLEAQMRNSAELLQQQIRFMSDVRDCWIQAERQLQRQASPVAVPSIGNAGGPSEWNA